LQSITTAAQESTVATTFQRIGPDPKPFTPNTALILSLATASFQGLVRLASGGLVYGYSSSLDKSSSSSSSSYSVGGIGDYKYIESSPVIATFPKPQQPLELYEFESCPFCRKVREAVNILDLDVLHYPCPRDGPTYRTKAKQLGGKAQFPYLVDPNTGVSMYESDDIINYLFKTYGPGEEAVPRLLKPGTLSTLTCGLAMLPRLLKGAKYVKRDQEVVEQPLIYWGYEASPFCKIVRERLVELEIPFMHITVARGSPKRQVMLDAQGVFQAPFLEDPNTGVAMFESAAILNYLDMAYYRPWKQE